MWAVFCAAILASMRKRLRLKPPVWRLCHFSLVIIIVVGSTVHALLIEGTMGAISKTVLCVLVVAAAGKVIFDARPWKLRNWRKASPK